MHEPVQVWTGFAQSDCRFDSAAGHRSGGYMCQRRPRDLGANASRVLVFHHGVVGQELLASDDTPFVAKDEIVWACQVKNESIR